MKYPWDELKDFWDYIENYPYEDDPDYDGIHDGGIKGISDDAPEEAKKKFYKWQEDYQKMRMEGMET